MARIEKSVERRSDGGSLILIGGASWSRGRWAKRFALAFIVLIPLLLAGCGATGPVAQDRFFVLKPQPQSSSARKTPLAATLLVRDLSARGFLGGRQIIYRTRERPLETQRYDFLLWEEPPARAISGALATALRAARLFEYVVTPDQRGQADYILSGGLDRFEHLPTEARPRVAAGFRVALIRNRDRDVLFSRGYEGEEPAGGNTPEDMAEAFKRLTERLVGNAVGDLQALRPRLRLNDRR